MEEQAVALLRRVNGYLDDIRPRTSVRFQDEVRESLRAEGTVYKTIREERRHLRESKRS